MQIAQGQKKQYVLQLVHLYSIYLKWFLAEDIYVYSIDEVFIDVTHYLPTYKMTPRELATKVIQNVLDEKTLGEIMKNHDVILPKKRNYFIRGVLRWKYVK